MCSHSITAHPLLTQSVLVFVSSRRQTRLTAKDLMALCVNTASSMETARRFLRIPEADMENICAAQVHDSQLKLCLSFGIGLHHAVGAMPVDASCSSESYLSPPFLGLGRDRSQGGGGIVFKSKNSSAHCNKYCGMGS